MPYLALTLLLTLPATNPIANPAIRSVAQKSEFTRTATEAEVAEILAAADEASPLIERWTVGQSFENRPIQAVKIGFQREPSTAQTGERPITVIIFGGIHSGECAGKEALCQMIGELAAGQHADWLQSMRIVAIPSLSPDSNMRRAVDNRPGQVGPQEGMGQRPNAQGLDLNRDFIKLESPEIRALVDACNQFQADVLIDLHTTNGSQHRYELTYDPPHHPLTPPGITELLRGKLLPYVTSKAKEASLDMFYYGNFDRSHSRWTTYGYQGRYSTNYMGLRGGIGILSEAYSYADYPTRIAASHALVKHTLDYVRQQPAAIIAASRLAPLPSSGTPLPLEAEVAPFDQPVTLLGYHPDPAPQGVTREPHDYVVQYFGRFEPTRTAAAPSAYWIPSDAKKIIALLDHHGIQYSEQRPPEAEQLQAFRITSSEQAERPFQGHRMVSLDGNWQDANPADLSTGVWVPLQQPLGRVAAVLLQPESADSIATWNVVPFEQLAPGSDYPVLRAIH